MRALRSRRRSSPAASCSRPATPALAADAAIDGTRALPDRDTRTGQIRPTAAQRADARALGAARQLEPLRHPVLAGRPGRRARHRRPRRHARGRGPRVARRERGALPRSTRPTGSSSQSDNALAGGAGHAVTLPPDGRRPARPRAAGSSRSAWRATATGSVISAAGTLHGGTTLAGKPQLAPEQAVQKAAANAGEERSLAQIVPARQAGREGLRGLQAGRRRRRPVARRRWRSRPSATAGCPAYETIVLDTAGAEPEALPHLRRRAQRRDPRPREPRRPRRARPRAAPVRRSPASCRPPDGGCDVAQGPVHRRRRRRRPRDRRVRRRDTPAQDIVLGSSAARRSSRRPTRCARPSGSATRPPAASRRATTSSRCASSATAPRRPSRAPTPARSRSTTARRPRPTPRAGTRSAARRRTTPSTPTRGTTRTPTRARSWCWKASATPGDCDEVVGNLAARAPWDHDPKRTRRRTRRSATTPAAAESWTDGGGPGADAVPPGQRRRATTRSRGRTPGATPTATPARRTAPRSCPARASTSPPRSTNLFVAAQPDARLVLPARLHRGQLERPGVELRR